MRILYGRGRYGYWLSVGLLSLVLLSGVLSGCGTTARDSAEDTKTASSVKPALTVDERVEAVLASMRPAEKIGQMMMIGVLGTQGDENSRYMLQQYHIGGVILFDRNMAEPAQVRSLTAELQLQAGGVVPLFIALDEEGGEVVRMGNKLEAPPSPLEIGRSGRPELAREWAQRTAKNLQALGINVNLAPVADIGSIGTRHYSTNPAQVTDFVRAAADGYETEHEIYALKHFPGIGRGTEDSHLDHVVIDAPAEQLEAEDLMPFKVMFQEKKPENYFVLVSHILYPALDANAPASLSPRIMTGLLREQLGYQGIILTDDMEMGAVSRYHSFRDIGVKAVLAGADIVMVCHEYAHEQEVYLGLLEALEQGRISEERINASVRRILRAKIAHADSDKEGSGAAMAQ